VAFLPAGSLEPLRRDLGLTYSQGATLLALYPGIGLLGTGLGVLADRRSRRVMASAGALGYGAGLLLFAAAGGYAALVVAIVVMGLAGDALARATEVALVDVAGDDIEAAVARVTFLGTLGDLTGPALLAACLATALGWRGAFALAGLGVIAYGIVLATQPLPPPPVRRAATRRRPHPEAHVELEPEVVIEGSVRIGLFVAAEDGDAPEVEDDGAHEDDEGDGESSRFVDVMRDRRVLRLGVLSALIDVFDEPFLAFVVAYLTAAQGHSEEVAATAAGLGLVGSVVATAWASRSGRRTPPALVGGLLVGGVLAVLVAPHPVLAAAGSGAVGAAVNLGWITIESRALTLRPGQAGATSAAVSVVAQAAIVVPLLAGAVADRAGLTTAMLLYLALAAAYAAVTRRAVG
jgi:predicted MFS family arabinose efflux permease